MKTARFQPTFCRSRSQNRTAQWAINIPPEISETGKKMRVFFLKKEQARVFGQYLQNRLTNAQNNLPILSREQLYDAAKAFQILKQIPSLKDHSLLSLLENYLPQMSLRRCNFCGECKPLDNFSEKSLWCEECYSKTKCYKGSPRDQKVSKKQYSIQLNLRNRYHGQILGALRGDIEDRHRAEYYLNCTIPEFRSWIASHFQPGMTWENHGSWHLHHKIPCAQFDLRKEELVKICFRYDNYHPLWKAENLSKGAKFDLDEYLDKESQVLQGAFK